MLVKKSHISRNEMVHGTAVYYERGVRIGGNLRRNGVPPVHVAITDHRRASRRLLNWTYLQGPWVSMLTLTYHEGDEFHGDFKESKRQLNRFLQYLRDHGILYLWNMEWQRRGVPHYHVWMDKRFDDVGEWEDDKGNSWRPLAKAWLRASGQEEDVAAVKFALHPKCYTDWDIHNGRPYTEKYAAKNLQKVLPKGILGFGRWWGRSRRLILQKAVRHVDLQTGSEEERALRRSEWFQFRRQAKRFIERHYFKGRYDVSYGVKEDGSKLVNIVDRGEQKRPYRFARDLGGSMMPVRWELTPEHVECVKRLDDYYRAMSLRRSPRSPQKRLAGREALSLSRFC